MSAAVKCVGALLARNEAAPDRYLERAIRNAQTFCDEIVVLDDGSTDGTVAIASALGADVISSEGAGGWWRSGDGASEAPARARLWTCAQARADGGWIYIFDADHELIGIAPDAIRTLLTAEFVTAWACPLWDCWNDDTHHRVDGFWQAWRSPRPWLYRALAGDFSPRSIHTGHAPLLEWRVGLMPPGAAIRHLGYCNPQHRKLKYERYLNLQRKDDALART